MLLNQSIDQSSKARGDEVPSPIFPLRGLSGTVKHSVLAAIAAHVRRLYGTAPACPNAHTCPSPDRINK